MKIYLILFLSLFSIIVNAQDLSDREIKKLAKLDLEYSNLEQNDFIDEFTGEIISESTWRKLKERKLVK